MRLRRNGNLLFVATPAKLNLFLELLGKRADGFHQIETVMSTVSLFDELVFERMEPLSRPGLASPLTLDVQLVQRGDEPSEADTIPTDERNLIIRSLGLLRESAISTGRWRSEAGIRVSLWKRIPSAAGLGGASSDAAAALVAGNELWQLGFSIEQLAGIAARLGSDIPFFLTGGTSVCRGRGEIISPVQNRLGAFDCVIVKPRVSLPTGKVFSYVTPTSTIENAQPIIDAMAAGRIGVVAKLMKNRLADAADLITDEIEHVRRCFHALPCLGHQLSGSGSSYFGIFANRIAAKRSVKVLRARLPQARVFHVRSLSGDNNRNTQRMSSLLVKA